MRLSPGLTSMFTVGFLGLTSFGHAPVEATGLHQFLKDRDQSVCYQTLQNGLPTGLFFRFNVKPHSPLTTKKEERKHEHPRQTTYRVVGKSILLQPSFGMISVNGSVVVAKNAGARLSFTINDQLTVVGPSQRFVKAECATNTPSATPDIWERCASTTYPSDGNNFTSEFSLEERNPLTTSACSLFQNPSLNGITESEAGEGSGGLLGPR